MKRIPATAFLLSYLVLKLAACSTDMGGGPYSAGPEAIAIEYPDGIDPTQTSDDPTYGFEASNPIKVGGPEGFSGPSSEQLYLRHLRDTSFRPYASFHRRGSRGGNPDGHIIDAYELTDQDGAVVTIFIDMYHTDVHPFNVKAPQGLYFYK